MNLLLLTPESFIAPDRVLIQGRQLRHMQEIHHVRVGNRLRAGLLQGNMGNAEVAVLTAEKAELVVSLDQPPPPRLPVTLVLALPRPKVLRRILKTVASMGIERLILVNGYRVEKSFWQTPLLRPETIQEQFTLGLEQGRDTIPPTLVMEPHFKPFVQDRLPELLNGHLGLIAHPGNYPACPHQAGQPVLLAIGPEGGWIPYEVDLLCQAGLSPVQMGPRILLVETAITSMLAKLY